jgi:hypothetical protein
VGSHSGLYQQGGRTPIARGERGHLLSHGVISTTLRVLVVESRVAGTFRFCPSFVTSWPVLVIQLISLGVAVSWQKQLVTGLRDFAFEASRRLLALCVHLRLRNPGLFLGRGRLLGRETESEIGQSQHCNAIPQNLRGSIVRIGTAVRGSP